MRCRRRRRDRLLHAGRIGAHGGAHLPEGPQGQGSRPMADYLCQTVLATHLCLDSLSPTAAAALPPSVPPKRKSTENLFCGRSHLRRRLHPATTRPSRDNTTDRAPARLASFGASSWIPRPRPPARRGPAPPQPVPACDWQLPLGAATKAVGPPKSASVLTLALIGLPAAPQQDCSWPSPPSEPARPPRSIYQQQVRRRPALPGLWLGSHPLFRLVVCVCACV